MSRLPASSSVWVVSWGNSPENASATAANPGGQEQSFRSFFYPTVSGTQERIRLSNYYGSTPVTVGSARLAVATATGATIDPTRDAALTFGGSKSVTIPPGAEVVSDTVSISYTFGEKMAVSLYVPGAFPPLTQHNSLVTVNYASASGAGDTTSDASGASFTQPNNEWYLLRAMDVLGDYQGTVALFGSSSIDGFHSNFGDTSSYPAVNVAIATQDSDRPSDWLARELNAAGYKAGVLNAGILADSAGDAASAGPDSGEKRISRDVLTQANVKTVIIYLGAVDIRQGSCADATEVEAALTSMVSQANAVGVRVVLGTLPPSAYCNNPAAANSGLLPTATDPYSGDVYPGPENPGSTQRRLINTWIRNNGSQLPGVVAVADFDQALAYPAHPDFMLPNLNSGDNYHPNGTGYGVQSSAIPLGSLLAR